MEPESPPHPWAEHVAVVAEKLEKLQYGTKFDKVLALDDLLRGCHWELKDGVPNPCEKTLLNGFPCHDCLNKTHVASAVVSRGDAYRFYRMAMAELFNKN
jgi:hypothetical protein